MAYSCIKNNYLYLISSRASYCFRLMFSRSQHHVTAQVFSSCSPIPVLSCSTKEWAVKKELASTNCVAACQAVGEVLAQRCQQAGITRMVYRAIPWTYRSDSVSTAGTRNKVTVTLLHWGSHWLHISLSLWLFCFAGSVFQSCNESRRNHSKWTQKEICWVLTVIHQSNPLFCINLYPDYFSLLLTITVLILRLQLLQ